MTRNTNNKKNTSNKKREPLPPSLGEWEQCISDDKDDDANMEEELEVVQEQRTKKREDRGGSSSKCKARPQKKQKGLPLQRSLKRKNR